MEFIKRKNSGDSVRIESIRIAAEHFLR